tara:strand:- start:830 stop:1426 length:597 start_codon:yes stop_codon:yes gene_type:complete
MGRDTHERANDLAKHLKELGWSVWFDENDMGLNLDASMVNGIEHCDVFVLCLTNEYTKQLNTGSFNLNTRSNCLKEFTYANARNKLIVCVMFEPFSGTWPMGIITMYLSNMLYVNGTGNDLKKVADQITNLLRSQNISPDRYKTLWKNAYLANILCRKKPELVSRSRNAALVKKRECLLAARRSRKVNRTKIQTIVRI